MPGLIRRLWRIAAGLLAVVVILAAVMVGLARLALVQVPEYRDQIESWAGEVLGWPVEIGGMDARLGLRGPELHFTDARILTQDRERTMVLADSGTMRFDSVALLRGRIRPDAVSLGGVALRIERSIEGRWRLLGEEGPLLGERIPPPDGEAELPWLEELPAARLKLEDLRLEFEDLRNEVGPWDFQVDELDLRLGGGQLELSATGMLPQPLGRDLAVAVTITGQDERGRPRDWSAGLSFAALDLRALGEVVRRPQRLPASGILTGSVSIEVDDAKLRRLAGDVQAHEVSLPEPPEGERPAREERYDHLGADFEWQRTAGGWEARVTELDVERAGRRWTSPVVAVTLERAAEERRLEVRADYVDLEDAARAVPWLPPRARSLVRQLAPSGVARDLEMHLDLPADDTRAPDVYVDARVENLALAAGEHTPGIRNVSGTISGDLYRGSASFEVHGGEVSMPRLFRAPLALTDAEVALEWTRDEQAVRLEVPRFALANDDATVSGRAALTLPADESSPHLEIDAVARDVRLAAAAAYLPAGIMPVKVVGWLDEALKAGSVEEASLEFRGATREFPFRDGDGLFKAEFDITGGELNFHPTWPNATGLDAAVRFENEGVWAEVRGTQLRAVGAGPAQVAIPDLAQGMLSVVGEARGELADFRELVLATGMLRKILGPGLEPAEIGAGNVSAGVDLSLPLRAIREFRAQVELEIEDGVVAYGFLGEPLRDVDARISIDNARVTAQDASASLAGWPVAADVVVTEDGAVRVEGSGRISADGLARALRVPVDSWADGESDWVGHLQFPAPGSLAPLELEIVTHLYGISIDLPEPFRKEANDVRNLQATARFPEAGLMDMEFEWNRAMRVAARVDRSGPEAVLGVVPGAVAGEPPGLVFSGAVNRLDLGAWMSIEVPAGVEADGIAASIAGGRLLVGELAAPWLRLGDALIELSRADDGWHLQLTADNAAGEITIPSPLYGDRPVAVTLDHLWLDAGRAGGPEDERPPADPSGGAAAPATVHPARIPALDVAIEDVRYGEIRLGSVSARVLHQGDGFELVGLEAVGDSFIVEAEGSSRLSQSVDESRLGLRVSSENVGATLQFMGFTRSMEATDGLFESEVHWQGGLRSDWLSAIEGDARILIRDGKLVGVEPGAGRVFGLLSIQALPRRLALDFKDVFGEGTAFDRIGGDFRFAGGNAYTENLVMRGPAVEMGVIGRTGLVARDYEQTAVIGADLGRTLPVAGAVVGGPAVGAALYLLSEILRKPFQAHITYRISGPWDDPAIERVSGGRADPARAAPDGGGAPDEGTPAEPDGAAPDGEAGAP